MQLSKNEYWRVVFNLQDKIIETKWTSESVNMPTELFKQHIIEFSRYVFRYKPKGFITDSQEGHYVMSPAMQLWHDNEIMPIYIESGLKKIAFVLPKDIFEAVSLEQTFQEKQAKKIAVRHFENEDEAFKWIKE